MSFDKVEKNHAIDSHSGGVQKQILYMPCKRTRRRSSMSTDSSIQQSCTVSPST